MVEFVAILIKLFWTVIGMFLIVAECFFCIQLQDVKRRFQKVKKEYSLSSNNGHNGHKGRPRADIENDLVNLKIEIISWGCIAVAGVYALFDCFATHIVQ